MANIQRITPCLWFDEEAEEAVNYYISIFDNSRIHQVSHYSKGMHKPEGTVLTIDFELDGQKFVALNGGPEFKFTEAISLTVNCETQAEVDYFWDKLCAGGAPVQCGWLKDKFGLSWQVVPVAVAGMITGNDERAGRVIAAIMGMVKLDLDALQRAYDGR